MDLSGIMIIFSVTSPKIAFLMARGLLANFKMACLDKFVMHLMNPPNIEVPFLDFFDRTNCAANESLVHLGEMTLAKKTNKLDASLSW